MTIANQINILFLRNVGHAITKRIFSVFWVITLYLVNYIFIIIFFKNYRIFTGQYIVSFCILNNHKN